MSTLNDLVPDVLLELGNRADINTGAPSRVAKWLKSSYLQIGNSYRFAEADDTTDQVLAPNIGQIAYPDTARAIVGVTVYRSDGSAIPCDVKDLTTIRRYNNNPQTSAGPPSQVAYFGKQIFFAPAPDNADTYTCTIDFWGKPVIAADIVSTLLLVPDDWLEVITYGAILRGHSALLERDKAQQIQQLLFGMTVPATGKIIPGLCAEMYSRYQAEAGYRDYGMAPSAARRSYTSTS